MFHRTSSTDGEGANEAPDEFRPAAGITPRGRLSGVDPKRELPDAAWIIAFDDQGNDLALKAELDAMTQDDRDRTEERVRSFVEKVRPTLRPRTR